MSQIPRENSRDSTLAFLSEGYMFISNRCARYHTDIFETRLMFRKAICIMGEEAARMFYHPGRFTRKGAIPPTARRLLQEKGSVQWLNGEAHRHRKEMFLGMMTPESSRRLVATMTATWHGRLKRWRGMPRVVLHTEVEEILCRAVCQWAGIPLAESDARPRTRQFSAMIDGAGAIGPRYWWGLLLRARNDLWLRGLIEAVRRDALHIPEGSALHAIAWHRGPDGKRLDTKTAALELSNVLRPTVAVARFVTFAAVALHVHPECRSKFLSGEKDYPELFAQEVRRLFPFFPTVPGRVINEFNWRGHHFAKGTWVLLDIYGTNRDPLTWEQAAAFFPERFRKWNGSAFNFIAQGGGEFHNGHRCPGERITIELLKSASTLLARSMYYDVPEQDLSIVLSRIPAIPRSRFVISNVRPVYSHSH
jgi:fatty-acid peroxygenase